GAALTGIETQLRAGDTVRAVVAMARVGPIGPGGDVQWEARGDRPNRAQFPAADDAGREAVIEVLAALAHGQFIKSRGDKAVTSIEYRQAALATHADSVLGLELIGTKHANTTAVINGLRERVT